MNVLEGWVKTQTTGFGQQNEEENQLDISKVVVGLDAMQASEYSKKEEGKTIDCALFEGS